jgi:hypothetical protein
MAEISEEEMMVHSATSLQALRLAKSHQEYEVAYKELELYLFDAKYGGVLEKQQLVELVKRFFYTMPSSKDDYSLLNHVLGSFLKSKHLFSDLDRHVYSPQLLELILDDNLEYPQIRKTYLQLVARICRSPSTMPPPTILLNGISLLSLSCEPLELFEILKLFLCFSSDERKFRILEESVIRNWVHSLMLNLQRLEMPTCDFSMRSSIELLILQNLCNLCTTSVGSDEVLSAELDWFRRALEQPDLQRKIVTLSILSHSCTNLSRIRTISKALPKFIDTLLEMIYAPTCHFDLFKQCIDVINNYIVVCSTITNQAPAISLDISQLVDQALVDRLIVVSSQCDSPFILDSIVHWILNLGCLLSDEVYGTIGRSSICSILTQKALQWNDKKIKSNPVHVLRERYHVGIAKRFWQHIAVLVAQDMMKGYHHDMDLSIQFMDACTEFLDESHNRHILDFFILTMEKRLLRPAAFASKRLFGFMERVMASGVVEIRVACTRLLILVLDAFGSEGIEANTFVELGGIYLARKVFKTLKNKLELYQMDEELRFCMIGSQWLLAQIPSARDVFEKGNRF